MQTMIGRQLKAAYELPQELSPDLAALLLRLDRRHAQKA
jgi:hypothetical protein